MQMTIFETVKSSVTTLQAAERYGLKVGRGGMCKCPFHNDRNPSMKVDKRFHCFGCQADGDVITFTSRLFNLPPREAAQKLAVDFGIQYDERQPVRPVRKAYEISPEELMERRVSYCFRELTDYRNQLVVWQEQYAPKTQDEEWDPLFLKIMAQLELTEYQLDVLQTGNDAEKKAIADDFISTKRKQEGHLMEPIVNTPIYRESGSHARKFGEIEQFRASHWANIDCKKDIEKAISSHFDGFRLDRKCIDEVMEKYGPERVSLVLAATVQVKSWDGRFSSANKDWAFTFDFPDAKDDLGFDRRDNYAVTSHPAVLDGFINLARQKIHELEQPAGKERNSIAPEAAAPARQQKKKAHSMER